MAEPLATRTATTPTHAASAPAATSTPSNGTAAPSPRPIDRPPDHGRLRDLLETATLVLAPTTVITALLFYFGWARTNALFGRLGIDQSALGFTVQDYLLRSVNSTFRPLSVVLLAATAGLSVHIALSRALAGVGWRSGCGRRPWWRAGCCSWPG